MSKHIHPCGFCGTIECDGDCPQSAIDALIGVIAMAVYADMENHPPQADVSSAVLLDAYRNTATAALQAIEAAGYRVVPVEATEGMQRAFTDAALKGSVHGAGGWFGYAREQWSAMLSAAPRVGEGV